LLPAFSTSTECRVLPYPEQSRLAVCFTSQASPPFLPPRLQHCLFVRDIMAITWESMAVAWDKPQHTFLLLWDLDCEFQDLHHIYNQLPTKIARKRASWMRLGAASQDDILRKSLNLGRDIQVLMATGKERFGTRFEQGDCEYAGRSCDVDM
jgi:hypothetical protein